MADFYATINHHLLLDKLAHYVPAQLLQLTQCALRYSYGPDFTTKTIGLPRGSSLSPVLANFYLHDLDIKLWRKRETTFYQRYMDDIIIVCPNKKPLRRAIKTVKSYIAQHKQTLSHPKSTLGRNKHFVYLGQHFDLSKLTP